MLGVEKRCTSVSVKWLSVVAVVVGVGGRP